MNTRSLPSLRDDWDSFRLFKRTGNKEGQRLCVTMLFLDVAYYVLMAAIHFFFLWAIETWVGQARRFGGHHFESSLSYFIAVPFFVLCTVSLMWTIKNLFSFYVDMGVLRFTEKGGEFLLHLLLPRENRAGLIGDLAEEADAIREKFGPRHARIFWWCEVIKSLGPLLVRAVQKLLSLGVLDWIRRSLSN